MIGAWLVHYLITDMTSGRAPPALSRSCALAAFTVFTAVLNARPAVPAEPGQTT